MSNTVNVVLMRGLLGDYYSRGMDRLGARLAKLPGVDYVSVEDYGSWRSIRDRIATSLGLQQLDLFLTRILNTLFHQSNMLPKGKLHLLLNYDPQRIITGLEQVNNNAVGIN